MRMVGRSNSNLYRNKRFNCGDLLVVMIILFLFPNITRKRFFKKTYSLLRDCDSLSVLLLLELWTPGERRDERKLTFNCWPFGTFKDWQFILPVFWQSSSWGTNFKDEESNKFLSPAACCLEGIFISNWYLCQNTCKYNRLGKQHKKIQNKITLSWCMSIH